MRSTLLGSYLVNLPLYLVLLVLGSGCELLGNGGGWDPTGLDLGFPSWDLGLPGDPGPDAAESPGGGPAEWACDDGRDNDEDGRPDCEDPDCAAACTPTPQSEEGNWPASYAQREGEMFAAVNRYRAQGADCGGVWFPPVAPLSWDTSLERAGRGHSLDMAQRDYFDHDSPEGVTFDQRIDRAGFRGSGPWGENIQAGSSTAAGATRNLIESPGHCRNIMSPDFGLIGVGYAFSNGADYGHYWTQDFAGR